MRTTEDDFVAMELFFVAAGRKVSHSSLELFLVAIFKAKNYRLTRLTRTVWLKHAIFPLVSKNWPSGAYAIHKRRVCCNGTCFWLQEGKFRIPRWSIFE